MGDQSVRAVPKSGGAAYAIATLQGGPARIAVNAGFVYFYNVYSQTINRAPRDGSAVPTVLATIPGTCATNHGSLAVLPPYVYAGCHSALYRTLLTGGGPDLVLTLPDEGNLTDEIYGLVADERMLFLSIAADSEFRLGRFDPMSSNLTTSSLVGGVIGGGLGVGASFAYLVSGVLGVYDVRMFDKQTLAVVQYEPVDDTGMRSSFPTPDNIVEAGCGAIWPSAHWGGTRFSPTEVRSLQFFPFADSQQITLLSTTAKRVATDGSFLYWTDTSGAVGRLPVL
jgi:hypothetical protein